MKMLASISPIIALVALVIAIVALVLAIYLCLRQKAEINNLHERNDKRKNEIQMLEQQLHQEIRNIKGLINPPKSADRSLSPVTEPAVQVESKPTEPIVNVDQPETEQHPTKPSDIEHSVYASAYDHDGNKFFAIESSPSQKTIYEITYFESNPDVGYFTICKDVEKKVVECRDHLDTACEMEGRGKRIDWDSVTPGKVRRKDNNWVVETPLTGKFI